MNGDASSPQQGKTALVVDDEPIIQMLVAQLLDELGFATIEARNGPAGLKVLQSNASVDLLVTDVRLPGDMNGRQLADAARVTRPDLKVLFVTGYSGSAVLELGPLDAGMRLLHKPFTMEALASRIGELILES